MPNMTDYARLWEITVEVVKDRGAQIEDGWEHHAYRVRLHKLGDMVTPEFDWRQGYGIEDSAEDRPDAILDCLVSDAWSVLNSRGFEDWANELGYDPDSRKAERTYNACRETAEWLDTFLEGDLEHVATTIERL